MPLVLNTFIIAMSFVLMREWINIDIVFGYLIVWLFLATNMSIYRDLYSEKKMKKLKYYFIESSTNLVNVYYIRYIIYVINNLLIVYCIAWILRIFGFTSKSFSIIDICFLLLAFISVYFIFLILCIMGIVYDRFSNAINFIKSITFFGLVLNKTCIAPMAGVVNNVAIHFFTGLNEIEFKVTILVNLLIYSIIGYLISVLVVEKMKFKIIN